MIRMHSLLAQSSRNLTSVLGIMLLLAWAVFVPVASAQDKQSEYRLGDGDTIRITVFQNPDLTLETRVTENGTIRYPLVGVVQVGGLTLGAAEQAIAKGLQSGNFIKQPQVSIQLLQNRGNQVSVLGRVGRPGRYPLETFNTRLSEMLAIAGGIGVDGADTAIVTGTRDGKPFRKAVDVVDMLLNDKPESDLVVAGGDVIYVHREPKFYIYGEVQRPGSYRIELNMTIRQALAQGGGLTPKGTERNLGVYRRAADGTVALVTVDFNEPVQPGDVLHVRESLF